MDDSTIEDEPSHKSSLPEADGASPVSIVLLGAVFFTVITPFGYISRFCRKYFSRNTVKTTTYWKTR